MNFTDIFIRRPVLASVVSLVILVLGLRAAFSLSVREFPETETATVNVSTVYYGASPDVVAGFITTPLESAIAQAQGIDYMTSSSASGVSTITAHLRLNYDGNQALSEINTKVNSVLNQLPADAQQPTLSLQNGQTTASMYLAFTSDTLANNQITDYLIRVVQPKLQTVPGVQQAQIIGGRRFALRAWLDPVKMAASNVTATDIYSALAANNYLSAIGKTRGQMISVDMTAGTDLHSLSEFRNLVVKQKDGAIVRLDDVAKVTLGAEDYDSDVAYNGKTAVFIGIFVAPDANLLSVMDGIRKVWPDIKSNLPSAIKGNIGYDASSYVRSAIDEVVVTLVEALVIVTAVIFLFLGSVRSVTIPVIAMPLSLIGAFFMMLVLGYSINLLTLLALVLAIGLVVDDAIIIVENVDRHMKEGKKPYQAALLAARELAGPIISISVVLIAVYVPIGFQGGLTGKLFSEFAFTLAGAVAVSAIIALTLSPMLCSRFLRADDHERPFVKLVDRTAERVTARYRSWLGSALSNWPVVVVFGFAVVAMIFAMMKFTRQELAPTEDQNLVFALTTAAPNASVDQMDLYTHQVYNAIKTRPDFQQLVQVNGVPTINQGVSLYLAKPWDERSENATQIQKELQKKYNDVAGAKIFAFQPAALPGSDGGLPVQFVITTTRPFNELYQVSQSVLEKAQATGKFFVIDNSLKLDAPQTVVSVDRDKVALMGLTMQDVGQTLSAMLGGGYVNYFSISGRSYRVIPQVQQRSRLNADQLKNYYIRTADGASIPASTVISLKTQTVPESIPHFQQLNAATVQGVFQGTQGDALKALRDIAKDVLPTGYNIDYAGESRQYMQESGAFAVTMAFALIIIYLALAAQFESFVDPLVVIMSVPMAIFGAMIFVFLGVLHATLNIYTQVGLVTLVGLIAKHGILIVQFANELQESGMSKVDAIREAASIRLRPILMTTAAMALGVIPLVLASGAGAVGRNHMGLVIFTGILIGTMFTLFVVPAMYRWLGADHQKKAAAAQDDESQNGEPAPLH
ncbi:efflux RND transporter permease subunit [Solimonas marina]|uniref:MMPL family transporter n=1 Tax=Solimonas marina TaxID=2714601 RepID=A0A970B4X2_9GAMM|nr:efflux RND transporter permease subunit [Solimonas marina]NKF22777.1 MMPL family transporter [Solimonas marina]